MADTDSGTQTPQEAEREVERTRARLETSIDELSSRMQPGAIFEEGLAYLREGGGAEFTRNLGREIRANPLPLLLIGVGIAWLAASASRAERDRERYARMRYDDDYPYDPRQRRMAYQSGDPYGGRAAPSLSGGAGQPIGVTSGDQAAFNNLVTDLVHLEHDAIAAYDAAIEKLSAPGLKDQVRTFKTDHLQHLDVLGEMGREAGAEVPAKGDAKKMLTTGKVAVAGLVGDGAILKAMKTNEDQTVAAYERAARHDGARPESVAFFEKALADERRHRDWMERTASAL